jgi:hypothetical protein
MEQRPALRASDADREHIADRLRDAATEGRLTPDEYEERLHGAYSARTYGQLDRLVADLPAPTSAALPVRRSGGHKLARAAIPAGIAFALASALAGMSVDHVGVSAHPASGRHSLNVAPIPHPVPAFLPAFAAVLVIVALCVALAWVWRQGGASSRRTQ